jgi:hypothetical protein
MQRLNKPSKHSGVRDNTLLVTYDRPTLLSFRDRTPSVLTAGLSNHIITTKELTSIVASCHLGDKIFEVRRDEPLFVLSMLVIQSMVDHEGKIHHQLEQNNYDISQLLLEIICYNYRKSKNRDSVSYLTTNSKKLVQKAIMDGV